MPDTLTPDQAAVLRSALQSAPRGLVSPSKEGELFEKAVEAGGDIFDTATTEWRRFQEAEMWLATINRPFRRALLRQIAGFSNKVWVPWITVLGSILLFAPLVELSLSPLPQLLALYTAFIGLTFPLALRLVPSQLRLVRLIFNIDLRHFQARLNALPNGFSNFVAAVGCVGLFIFVSSLAEAQSQWFRSLALTILSIGVLLTILPSMVMRGFRYLVLNFDEARAERDLAKKRLEDQLRSSGQMWLREKLNAEAERSYQTTLSFKDHSGLAEIDDPAREIPTQVRKRLLRKMKRMPGGTIGLAGSRGAGKTTLLRSICTAPSTRFKEEDPLSVIVDAPTLYDSRDFVLYLFAQVCSEVVGHEQVREMRGSNRPFGYPTVTSTTVLGSGRLLFGLGCLGAGVALLLLSAVQTDDMSSPFVWGVLLSFFGYFSFGIQAWAGWRRRQHLGGQDGSSPPDGPGASIADLATLRLRQIWFQQSFSAGWSGSFKAPVGLEGGISTSTDLAEQQLSFPDIVALLREFLSQLTLKREVRICIDELDKMDDETARRFLNEIKVVFRIPDCFFLISISEDAMSFFERRGLPIRDVFDSSFDDVLHVPHLQFDVSRTLLDRRIVELPLPFACLLHCISGGLPRDLIRAARELVDLRNPLSPEDENQVTLGEATAKLLQDSLMSKVAATRVAVRNFEYEEHTTLLIGWLDQVKSTSFFSEDLLGLCANAEGHILRPLWQLPRDPDLRVERREVQKLAVQLIAFVYYAATMLEFFAEFVEPSFVDQAVEKTASLEGDVAPVDRLAAVTQTFTVDVNSSWTMLSRFREDLELRGPLAFPRVDPETGAAAA